MKKYLTFAFLTASFFGMLKMLTIAPFDRMSADDFSYTTVAFTQGILKAQIAWYTTFTGKFINNFLVTVFGIMSSRNGSTLVYFLITLVLLFSAIFIFFKKVTNSRLGPFYSVLLSLLFLVSYYLITPDKNESWYWLSGSVEYLWPTIFVIGGLGFALEKKSTLFGSILLFVLAFLVGGGSEVAGTILVVSLFLSLLYLALMAFLQKREGNLLSFVKTLFTDNKLFVNLFIIFLGASLSFLIMYLSPGNAIRIKGPGSDEMNIIGALFYSLQKGPALTFTIIKENFVYLLSLLVSLSAFFSFAGVGFEEFVDRNKTVKKIFFILVAPFFLSIIYMLPGYRALGRVLPSRAEIDLSFIILVSLIYAALYLSRIFMDIKLQKYFLYNALISATALIFLSSSLLAFTKTVAEDIYIAKNYSDAFDSMFMKLKDAASENKNQIVIVSPLPESGLIHSEKLKVDPGHWANKPISNFFGLEGITTEAPKPIFTKIAK